MKRTILLFFLALTFANCQAQEDNLLQHLKKLSSDEMEGRGFGTFGSKLAKTYIVEQFEALGLQPAFNDSYLESFIHKGTIGNNIVGIIPGKSEEIIVITAHYDHLGVKDGQIYNGADDNASGTAALFSITKHLIQKNPNHTFVIAAVDAEEIGSIGAEYLINHFPKPFKNVVLNINLDMIAHNDNQELYACGTYYYPQLKPVLAHIESPIDLKLGHDSPEYKGGDDWTYASDHRVFHKRGIPFIYFGVEDHADYHEPTDTYENINETFYLNAVALIIEAIDQYDQVASLKTK